MSAAREDFLGLLKKQPIRPADALLFFAGDGFERVPHAAQLFAAGHAPLIVIVSNDRRYEYGSRPAGELADALIAQGVTPEALHIEECAQNTKEEADRFAALARERGWKRLMLVSSPHHMPRALLTMLGSLGGERLVLVPAAAPLERDDLVPQELERIALYQKKGDVASYEEGVNYFVWLSKQ